MLDPADWDEGARQYLEDFLTLRTPYAATIPTDHEASEDEVTRALTRRGRPESSDEDFKELLDTLGYAGYGWLRPEGVRHELEEMSRQPIEVRRKAEETRVKTEEEARRKAEGARVKDEKEKAWNRSISGRITNLFTRRK